MIINTDIYNKIIYAEYAARVNGVLCAISIIALSTIVGFVLADKILPICLAYNLGAVLTTNFVQGCILLYQIEKAKAHKINLKKIFGNDLSHQIFVQPFMKNISSHKPVYHN